MAPVRPSGQPTLSLLSQGRLFNDETEPRFI